MIIRAVVEKLATDDGLVEFEPHVQLGKTYLVETDSIRRNQTVVKVMGDSPISHEKDIIFTVEGVWLPLETLRLVMPDGRLLKL